MAEQQQQQQQHSPQQLLAPSLAPQQRHDHDVCRSDAQCLHGGRCRGGDTFGSYTYCACPAGYGGDRCEDHCPLECFNGGRCIANNNWSGGSGTEKKRTATYHCKCLGLFTGSVCSLSYVNCNDGNRCYNGGMCIAARASLSSPSSTTAAATTTTTSAMTTCACPDGYVGPRCRTSTTLADAAAHNRHAPTAGSLSSNVLALSAAVAALGLVVGVLVAFRARRRKIRPTTRRRRRGGASFHPDNSDDDYLEPCYYAGVEMLEGKDENEHDDEEEEEQEEEEHEESEEQEQEQEEIRLNRNIV